jgi:hypothetical protein
MLMLQTTHDIRKVALWLGHSSVQTTEVYLRADPTEKLEAVSALTPRALRRGRFSAPDQLVAMLTTGKTDKDYAKQATSKPLWIGPRRRLTVHNRFSEPETQAPGKPHRVRPISSHLALHPERILRQERLRQLRNPLTSPESRSPPSTKNDRSETRVNFPTPHATAASSLIEQPREWRLPTAGPVCSS